MRSVPRPIFGNDGRGEARFTSRQIIEAEQRLQRAADLMAGRDRQHHVADHQRDTVLAHAADRDLVLLGEQKDAFRHVTDGRDLFIVVSYAGTGKSAMLGGGAAGLGECGL